MHSFSDCRHWLRTRVYLFTTPSLTNAHGMYAEVLHLAFKALTIMEVPPFGEA